MKPRSRRIAPVYIAEEDVKPRASPQACCHSGLPPALRCCHASGRGQFAFTYYLSFLFTHTVHLERAGRESSLLAVWEPVWELPSWEQWWG